MFTLNYSLINLLFIIFKIKINKVSEDLNLIYMNFKVNSFNHHIDEL